METQFDRRHPMIRRSHTRRRRLGAVLAALLGAVASTAGVTTPAAALAAPAVCPAPQTLTGTASALARPVVLVHGWTGRPMADTAHDLLAEPDLPVDTYLFDYSRWSAHWVTDPHIAACLADYVHAVSEAYQHAGGDGRVIVVAHSMGGLAIRYATNAAYVAHPVTAAELGAVITFDTPELGSPFGNTAAGRLWETAQSRINNVNLPAGGAGDGEVCLAQHDHGGLLPSGCGLGAVGIPDPPPWLPAGISLTEIAGDITVDRSVFGIHLYSLPLDSDGIVTVASSHGYLTSGPGGRTQPRCSPERTRSSQPV
jgi:pimeloyl-ACP methyl ester carboxylesterase